MTRASRWYKAGLSGQSRYTALHTPRRLIRVFSSRSCASKVTKAAESAAFAVTLTRRPSTTTVPVKIRQFGRLFTASNEPPDTFREVAPRLEIYHLIHVCDSKQNDKRHAALNDLSFCHRKSNLPLSFTFRGFCKKWRYFWLLRLWFFFGGGMTNELPLCRGSQQLPQQLIDCGAWMMPSWMQGLVVSTDCSGRLQIGCTICSWRVR